MNEAPEKDAFLFRGNFYECGRRLHLRPRKLEGEFRYFSM